MPSKRRTRESLAPDITPLIDVVFLLLIFFMVSTVFKKDELALLLDLPKASQGENKAQIEKNLLIELTAEQVAINGKKTTLENLGHDLANIINKSLPVELRIDKEVKYQRVISLLDLLRIHQINNLALITDQEILQ